MWLVLADIALATQRRRHEILAYWRRRSPLADEIHASHIAKYLNVCCVCPSPCVRVYTRVRVSNRARGISTVKNIAQHVQNVFVRCCRKLLRDARIC